MNRINKAIFLDRDGTINKEVNYLFRPDDLILINGTAEAIRIFHELGYKVIIITNQAGIARGYYEQQDVVRLHKYINDILAEQGALIDYYYYCPHHPEGIVKQYKKICKCRKPHIGMIEQAVKDFDIDLSESIIVGDKEIDVQTGKNAGMKKSVLVRTGHHLEEENTVADAIYNNLFEFAQSYFNKIRGISNF